MMATATKLKRPLQRVYLDAVDCRDTDAELSELNQGDWQNFEEILSFLKPFQVATVHASGQEYCTFSSAIPLYNLLMDHLEKAKGRYKIWKDEWKLHADLVGIRPRSVNCSRGNVDAYKLPSVETIDDLINACDLCYEKLHGYYNIQSDLAIAATVLDPRLNVQYFEEPTKSKGQNEKLRDDAFKEAEFMYRQLYAPLANTVVSATFSNCDEDDILSTIYKKRKMYDASDQLKQYTKLLQTPGDTNPLDWWRVNEKSFPDLAKFARDILSIPSTSTPSERSFSDGKNLITSLRNRLNPESVEACLICKAELRNQYN